MRHDLNARDAASHAAMTEEGEAETVWWMVVSDAALMTGKRVEVEISMD